MRILEKGTAILSGVLAVILLAPMAAAPQDEQATTRVIEIQKFQVPRAAWPDFFKYVDKYWVPADKENPHLLSSRFASHYYGKMAQDMWIIFEYRDLAAMQQAQDWNVKHQNEKYPEGSEDRRALDEAYEKHFLPYWENHSDEILILNENRMK